MQYTIAAKPTRYAGVLFRSRLEARWAAFFDLMKWEWHYEPLDLDGWVPDFLLKNAMRGGGDALVEVKPVDPWDAGVAMTLASDLARIGRVLSALAASHARAGTPVLEEPIGFIAGYSGPRADERGAMSLGMVYWPAGSGGEWTRLPLYDGGDPAGKWAEAGNAIQWRPKNGSSK